METYTLTGSELKNFKWYVREYVKNVFQWNDLREQLQIQINEWKSEYQRTFKVDLIRLRIRAEASLLFMDTSGFIVELLGKDSDK